MSAPQANDRDKPLIRRDLVAIRVGGGRALLLEPGTATAHELPEAAAAAILSCRCFDSLAGHAARIRRNNDLPPNSDVRLEAELERAVAAGLFATWTDTWTNVAGRDGPRASDVRIDRVAVATRDRPVALARALQSHFALARAAGRTMRAHVVDSSPTEASAAHSRTAALAIAQEAGFPVRYANLSDRNDFVGRLARRADVDPDLVRFALSDLHGCGSDVGANRNALLLGHVGRVFLSSDDDIHVDSTYGDPLVDRLRITSTSDPTKVTLFASSPGHAMPPSPGNLFSEHEALLGRSLPALLRDRSTASTTVDMLSPALLRALVAGTGRVAVTSSGLLGDCGASYPSFYLWRSDVRDQVAHLDEENYRALVESRLIHRRVDTATVTSGAFFMSTHVGFDHRSLLPPFFPALRGADLIFGRLLRMSAETDLIGHIPRAALHAPLPTRRASRDAFWPRSPSKPFFEILDACLRVAGAACALVGTKSSRLSEIGRQLQDIGRLEDAPFNRLIGLRLLESTGARLLAWQGEIDRLKSPSSPWSRDLSEMRAFHLAAVNAQPETAGTELLERFGPVQGRQLTRTLVGKFGNLLEAWPVLSAAAMELEHRGQGLFRE